MTSRSTARAGVTMGVLAYGMWGVLPLYLHRLGVIGPLAILSHRIVWSIALIVLIATVGRRWGKLAALIRQPRLVAVLLLSALLIATNWLIYIVAVTSGHTVQASLGYFINPLINVLLGVIFLRERPGRLETAAIGLAGVGVAVMAIGQGGLPLLAIGVALSFGFYGLVRKMAPIEAFEGLAVETALLAPFALGFLVWKGALLSLPAAAPPLWFVMLAGPVTAVPLLLFAAAARRLRYSELGLIQYMTPTMQLLCAVLMLGEPLLPVQMLAFAFIWTGLVIYAAATWHRGRVPKPVAVD